MRRHGGTIALVLTAAAAAVVPMPPERVERLYSRGVYPAVQQNLTLVTNLSPIALLDVAAALLVISLVWMTAVRVRRSGWRRSFTPTVVTFIRVTAVVYLAFLALWGLNYRRVPLEEKLDYERQRVTRAAVVDFASRAAQAVNTGYQAAHQSNLSLTQLQYDFLTAESKLGSHVVTQPGVPKRSLLTWYFRRAAIDGMTDPIFLEIIVNPDVLEFERPMVVAHEWGHLAGYANEAEASFLAWLTCVRGEALSQYSAWLSAYEHALRALPRQDRAAVTPLEPGPREDLRAMAARYARSSPIVRRAAETVYDEYLRANRLSEGIGSYDAVLRLMVGTRFGQDWSPATR